MSGTLAGIDEAPPGAGEYDWRLWRRWIVANGAGEVVGIGAAALAGAALVQASGSEGTGAPGTAIVMIVVGTFEGMVVGAAQWLALRRAIPLISMRAWTLASALGAFIAWTLGMLPSRLIEMGGEPPEMSDAVMYGMAALMGLCLGPVLGIPQWLVLRRHLAEAGWWVAANAAAWMVGMPVIFAGVGLAAADGIDAVRMILVGAAAGFAAGAVVGAIHGLALLRLIRGAEVGVVSKG